VFYRPEPSGHLTDAAGARLSRTSVEGVPTLRVVHSRLGVTWATPAGAWQLFGGIPDRAAQRALGGAGPLARFQRRTQTGQEVSVDAGAVIVPPLEAVPLGMIANRALSERRQGRSIKEIARTRRVIAGVERLRVDYLAPGTGRRASSERGCLIFWRRGAVLIVLAAEWPESVYARLEPELDQIIAGLTLAAPVRD